MKIWCQTLNKDLILKKYWKSHGNLSVRKVVTMTVTQYSECTYLKFINA